MPIDDDVELDTDKDAAPKKKRSVVKIVVFVFIGLLLIGGGTGAALYFMGMLPGHEADAEDVASADTPADKKKGKKDKKDKKGKKKEEPKPALYLALDPPFVVNFQDQTQARYLQVTMEIMARDPAVIEAVKTHMPLIRNNLLMLLSTQTYAVVGTREGKEKIRTDSLSEIQKIMKEQTGDTGVEAVYLTSLVMQ